MNIGIDGSSLVGKLTGAGKYTFEICLALQRIRPDWNYYVYTKNRIKYKPIDSPNWIYVNDQNPFLSKIPYYSLWMKLRSGLLANRNNLDVFWGPTFTLPLFLNSNINRVLTIFDITHILFPSTIPKIHRLRHALFMKIDINNANLITTISQGTAEKLYKFYKVKNIICVRPGVNKLLYFQRSNDEIVRILNKYRVNSKYFLCIGTVEPRKNIINAIKAFIECKKLGQLKDYLLVIVGKDGWLDALDYQNIIDAQIYGVMRLGYIDDNDLPALYSATEALIFPSIYEGYGMPVSECLSCGSMVIASDIPEIREAGKNSAIYIKPTIENIMSAMISVKSSSTKLVFQPNDWNDSGVILATEFEKLLKKEKS